MQTLLLDILKQCNINKIDVLKVTPSDDGMRIQSFDSDRVLFIDARTHKKPEGITGEFGLSNFKILRGLLTLPNLQSDTATFKVGTRQIAGETFPDRLEFKGGGTKATFRLMSKEVVPDQPTIVNIPWDVVITIAPSKMAEFQQMASLYSDVENNFVVKTQDSNLVVDFGNDTASTHSASMVLAENVNSLAAEMKFPIDRFISLMKLASGATSSEVKLTSKGLLGVIAVTEHATYNYYVKKTV